MPLDIFNGAIEAANDRRIDDQFGKQDRGDVYDIYQCAKYDYHDDRHYKQRQSVVKIASNTQSRPNCSRNRSARA